MFSFKPCSFCSEHRGVISRSNGPQTPKPDEAVTATSVDIPVLLTTLVYEYILSSPVGWARNVTVKYLM